MKRRDDWIRDLNMNLIKGKVIKSTHYFDDELNNEGKIKLVKALANEPGKRDNEEMRLIEKYVRSMQIFKPYAHYKSEDFESLVQDIKLHKMRRGIRICNFGDNADRIYVIVNGRAAITYPNAQYFELMEGGGAKFFKERTQLCTENEVSKILRRNTLITANGIPGLMGDSQHLQDQKTQRLEEAKTKNKTFQLFDKMLGIEKNPKLIQIRELNPLNNINVPKMEMTDLDERID